MPLLTLSFIISFSFIFRVYKEKEEKREHEETRYGFFILRKARLLFAFAPYVGQAAKPATLEGDW